MRELNMKNLSTTFIKTISSLLALVLILGTVTLPVSANNLDSTATIGESSFEANKLLAVLGASYGIDRFDLLRKRWLDFTIGDENWDENDPDYSLKLSALENEAQGLVELIVSDLVAASRVFSDYPLGNKGSWYDSDNITKTFKRLQTVATAYATRGTSFYQDEDTGTLIVDSLDYVYKHHFNEKMSPYGNWFAWSIGAPMASMATTMIMWDNLTLEQITNYAKPSLKWPDHGDVSRSDRGANGIWRRKCDLYAGIVTKDSALLDDVKHLYPQFLDFVNSGQGFYSDGTHIYHSTHMYNGGYGLGHFRDVVEILYYLNDSDWDVSSNDLSNVYAIAYDAYIPLMPYGMMMSMSQGREITRTGGDLKIGQSAMASLMRLASSSKNEDDRLFINKYIKEWLSYEDVNNYFNSVGTISEIAMKNQLMSDQEYQPTGNVQKYHQYSTGDKAVSHSEQGYAAGLGMHSRRIYNFEIGDSNRKGWNINNGRLYLYTDDINQHEDATKPTIDWDRLPGTTVVRGTGKASSGFGRVGAFAGGVGFDEKYGISSMFLRDKDNTLDAKKSYFFFDDEIVELGSGITTSDSKATETILENIKLGGDPSEPANPGPGDNRLVIDGEEKSNSIGSNETFVNPKYLWVEGNTSGSNFGAYFPNDVTINTLRETRSGKMSDLGTSNTGLNTVMERNYLSIYQNHGINPINEKYSFVLLPNRQQEDVANYSQSPDVEILAHEENLHAVYEKNLNMLALSSFASQKQSVDAFGVDSYISTDQPANIIVQESGNTLSLVMSDPLQSSSGKVSVIINRKAFAVMSKDDRIDVVKTTPYIELQINTGGSKGRVIAVELSMDINNIPPPPTQLPEKPVLQYSVDNDGISIFLNPVKADSYTLKYGRQIEGQSPTLLTETVEMGGTTATYIFDLIDDASYNFQVTATNALGSTSSDILEVTFSDDTKDYFEFVDEYDNLDLSKIYSMSPTTGWSWGNRTDVQGGGWCLVRPSKTQVSELVYSVPGMSGFDLNAYQSGEGGASGKYAAITFYTAQTLAQVESDSWTQIYPGNIVATDTGAKFYTDDYTINGLENANYLRISIAATGGAVWSPELERLTVRYPKSTSSTIEPTGINFVNTDNNVFVGRTVNIPYSAIPSTVRPLQLSKVAWTIDNPALAEVEDFTIDTVTVNGLAEGDAYLIATFEGNDIARIPLTISNYRPNLALNKTATLSRAASSGNTASALDGDDTTRFGYNNIGSSPGTITFTVDLGEIYEVTDFAILWETSRPKNYVLEGSDSGTDGTWSPITSRTQPPPSKPDWERFVLGSPINTRFVRLSTYQFTGNYGMSIFEFQAFGNVPIPTIESITISPTTLSMLETEKGQLSAVYKPEIAEGALLKWESSNPSVATVDENTGLVTAISQGTALISITDTDPNSINSTASCTVNVVSFSGDLPVYVSDITLTSSDTLILAPNYTYTIESVVSPTNAANKVLTYSSSNTKIATVDKKGTVTASSHGSAVIIVRNAASGVKTQLKVVVQEVNKDGLSQAISTANGLVKSEYTSESWTALENALAGAVVVKNSPDAYQSDIDNAYNILGQAIGRLVRLDSLTNKTALQLGITTATRLVERDYTTDSWANLEAALANANTVNNNSSATQTEVDRVLSALQNAVSALELVEIDPVTDKTALDAAIITASQLTQSNYTADSWKALKTALAEAILVSDNQVSIQEQINKALTTLQKAIANLKEITNGVSKTTLYATIKTASQLSSAIYTQASWNLLQTALAGANAVYANPNATSSEVDIAVKLLQNAISGLVRKNTNIPDGGWTNNSSSSRNNSFSNLLDKSVFPSNTTGAAGSGKNTSPISKQEAEDALNKASSALPIGATTISVTFGNEGKITPEVAQQLSTLALAKGLRLKINLDTIEKGKVTGRITLNNVITKEVIAGFELSLMEKIAKLFNKYFKNQLFVIASQHQGAFGEAVDIVYKAPQDISFEDILVYSYDPTTNTYTKLQNSKPWLDKNGYVHFSTNIGGCFVVSEGELATK